MALFFQNGVDCDFEYSGGLFKDSNVPLPNTTSYVVTTAKDNLKDVKYTVLVTMLDKETYSYMLSESSPCVIETGNMFHILEKCNEDIKTNKGFNLKQTYLYLYANNEYYLINISTSKEKYEQYENEIKNVITSIHLK